MAMVREVREATNLQDFVEQEGTCYRVTLPDDDKERWVSIRDTDIRRAREYCRQCPAVRACAVIVTSQEGDVAGTTGASEGVLRPEELADALANYHDPEITERDFVRQEYLHARQSSPEEQ